MDVSRFIQYYGKGYRRGCFWGERRQRKEKQTGEGTKKITTACADGRFQKFSRVGEKLEKGRRCAMFTGGKAEKKAGCKGTGTARLERIL